MYIYIYIYIYTCLSPSRYIYIYIYVYIYIYICIHKYVYDYVFCLAREVCAHAGDTWLCVKRRGLSRTACKPYVGVHRAFAWCEDVYGSITWRGGRRGVSRYCIW